MLYSAPQRDGVLLYLTNLQVGTEQAQFTTSALSSAVCLTNRTWFYWPKMAQWIFLTKLKGKMLVCLYGIKKAYVTLNSW